MNFLDTFDIARPVTPNPTNASTPAEQPSLNEEVNQVIGQLGRFWGGFRKQSQTALEAARKDLSEVVVQAQKELSKLTTAESDTTRAAPSVASGSGPSESDEEPSASTAEEAAAAAATASSSENNLSGSTTTIREGDELQSAPLPFPSSSSTSSTLFARLQSALPPNIVATVQSNLNSLNIPESIKHASDSIDLPGLRTNLLTELQRVQGVTLAQAEEYAHKSEALLREAVKEAGDVLREAVKVIPPDQAAGGSGAPQAAMLWDGTDMWLLPSDSSEMSASASASTMKGLETSSAVATRAEALLRRLKHDPAILRHDPEAEEGVKERYVAWKETEVDTLDGGMEGADWKAKVDAALEDSVDGQALTQLETTLVPAEMTHSVFWLRFFFRAYQIRMEEEKRKSLIHSSTDNEEEFSWEDEEDDASPTTGTGKTVARTAAESTSADDKKNNLSVPPAKESTSGTTSPRVSSEDSFDLVSSANVSTAGDVKPASRTEPEDEDGDSDWE